MLSILPLGFTYEWLPPSHRSFCFVLFLMLFYILSEVLLVLLGSLIFQIILCYEVFVFLEWINVALAFWVLALVLITAIKLAKCRYFYVPPFPFRRNRFFCVYISLLALCDFYQNQFIWIHPSLMIESFNKSFISCWGPCAYSYQGVDRYIREPIVSSV